MVTDVSSHDGRVIVGVLAFNEGDRVEHFVRDLKDATNTIPCEIVLLDESTAPPSKMVAQRIVARGDAKAILSSSARLGKVACLNILARYFLDSDADVLLHFDSDLRMEEHCVDRMVAAVRGGDDVVSAISLAESDHRLFARAVRVTRRGIELAKLSGEFTAPLIGHSGGYSRRAVEQLFPVPVGGVNEECFVLWNMARRGLRGRLVPSAVVRYHEVASLNDFVLSVSRVRGRERTFAALTGPGAEEMVRVIYRLPPMRHTARAVWEDPVAATLLPWLVPLARSLRRWSHPDPRDIWEVTQSSRIGG
jgi:hypothetical protein